MTPLRRRFRFPEACVEGKTAKERPASERKWALCFRFSAGMAGAQPHRADRAGITCFFRLMTLGRNTAFFPPEMLKA